MRVWLRLTSLFGLPDDEHPKNLLVAALGPILHASGKDLAEAPLPPKIQKKLDELARLDSRRVSRTRRNINRHEPTVNPIPNSALNARPTRAVWHKTPARHPETVGLATTSPAHAVRGHVG
jgi:hypothetical protein